jgi:hypothetical protein
MENNFDEKVEILAAMFVYAQDNEKEWIQDFYTEWKVTIPMCFALYQELVSDITEAGTDSVNQCFDSLCQTFDMDTQELSDFLLGK